MIKKEYVEFLTFTVNKSNDVSIDLKQFPTNHNVNNYLVKYKITPRKEDTILLFVDKKGSPHP